MSIILELHSAVQKRDRRPGPKRERERKRERAKRLQHSPRDRGARGMEPGCTCLSRSMSTLRACRLRVLVPSAVRASRVQDCHAFLFCEAPAVDSFDG